MKISVWDREKRAVAEEKEIDPSSVKAITEHTYRKENGKPHQGSKIRLNDGSTVFSAETKAEVFDKMPVHSRDNLEPTKITPAADKPDEEKEPVESPPVVPSREYRNSL